MSDSQVEVDIFGNPVTASDAVETIASSEDDERVIYVHFERAEDVEAFAAAINRVIPPMAKSIIYQPSGNLDRETET